jgi:general secretion pathway protein K
MLAARACARGMALVTVLWLIALLTIGASVVASVSIGDRRSVERLIRAESSKLAADGAIRLELLRLTSHQGARELTNGERRDASIGDLNVQVTIEREAGRVDLNEAPEELIARVFEAGGYTAPAARKTAGEIVSRRAPTSGSQSFAGAHGRFESVGEIQELASARPLSAQLLDAFTVYSHSPRPTLDAAPLLVRQAMRIYQSSEISNSSVSENATTTITSSYQSGQEVIRLTACVRSEHAPVCRVAIVRVIGSSSQVAQVFAWYTSW